MLNLELKPDSPRYKKIRRRLEEYIKLSEGKMQDLHEQWRLAEDKFYCYIPEKEIDVLRKNKHIQEGKPQYVTMVIPYSYAMLMTAHTYWTSVFFSRNPVFQFMARHGETKLNERAIEALIDYQNTVGQWLVPLYIWLLDKGKYGVGILGLHWCEEWGQISRIEEVEDTFLGMGTGKFKKKKNTSRVLKYQGNKLYNVRPFDWFPDPRVSLHRFQEGSFEGRYVEIAWEEIIANREYNGYFNIEELRKKQYGPRWKPRDEGSAGPVRPEAELFATNERDGPPALVPSYEINVKVIPSDWELGSDEHVEKWTFTITSDFQLIYGARPCGEFHDKFPKALAMMEAEGYALSSRGIMEILEPMQRTLDWLINTHFYNVRKTLNNQFIVDPSKVHMNDLLDPRAGGIIRLLPAAYGGDVRTIMQQVQTVDVTRTHIADAQMMMEMMQRVVGITDSVMGVMPGAGRRTAQEVRTSTQMSTNRLKTMTELASAMGFAPLSQMLVSNTQQYYDREMLFKIAGNTLTPGAENFLNITPDDIAGFYDYVPVDGTLPIDRYAQAQLINQILQMVATNPALSMQYDMGGMFAWAAQLAGFNNIGQFRFKTVIQPDEQVMYQFFKGDVASYATAKTELGGGAPAGGYEGGAGGAGGGMEEPGQLPGMGQTG
jgi:hypothetical protein